MKTLNSSLFMTIVFGLGLSIVMLLTHSPRTQTTHAIEATEANQQSQQAERNEPVAHQPALGAMARGHEVASVAPGTPGKTEVLEVDITSQFAAMMRVRQDQVLAKVNEQPILLKHLVPLQPGEQERAMTLEEYGSRLNRAIEMELTFQTAAAQGMVLTPEQKRRMDGIAPKHEATFQEYRKQGVTWSSVIPAQVEFEQRLTSALMLQQNLVAAEAHVAPASDANAQAHYEQARNEVLNRLRANSNISVSTGELSPM